MGDAGCCAAGRGRDRGQGAGCAGGDRVTLRMVEVCDLCEEDTPYGTSRYCYLCIIAGDAPLDEDVEELET